MHSDLYVSVYLIISLSDSIIAVLKSSMTKAVSSWRMLKRFLSVMLNFSLMSVSISCEMSGRYLLAITIFAFLSFKVIISRSKLWSLPTSAFFITHTSLKTSQFAIDDDMINLALGSSVR